MLPHNNSANLQGQSFPSSPNPSKSASVTCPTPKRAESQKPLFSVVKLLAAACPNRLILAFRMYV